uniref:4-nitrophenylphosphatase n=1 Tax=Acrobeloides nanus TaxID=290746 RepID=A0A914DMQ7_9BILA
MTKIPLAVRSKILSSYDTFIFDADGVLWLFNKAISGAPELLNSLIEIGKQVIILSNNSTRTIDEYVEKKTMEDAGIEVFGVGADHVEDYTKGNFLTNIDVSRKVSAVVVSYDIHFNYIKLMRAVNYLKDPNVDFIVTEGDIIVPGPVPDVILPCTGWISSAIRTVSGREPFSIGKPNSPVFNYISEKFNINPKRTLMTGDSCFSDIPFGNRHGFDTMLVLSGSHSLKDVEKSISEDSMEFVPKMYAPSVKTLLNDEEIKEENVVDEISGA